MGCHSDARQSGPGYAVSCLASRDMFKITWEMSKDTDRFLREYAPLFDLEFDELLGYLNSEIVQRAQTAERIRRN